MFAAAGPAVPLPRLVPVECAIPSSGKETREREREREREITINLLMPSQRKVVLKVRIFCMLWKVMFTPSTVTRLTTPHVPFGDPNTCIIILGSAKKYVPSAASPLTRYDIVRGRP